MSCMIDIINCVTYAEVKERLTVVLDRYAHVFPSVLSAKILIKPNLNANMNSLTGNTTDLRVLSVVLQYLRGKGYTNVVIGEGTNSGYYRNKIGVIARLHVDELAKAFGATVKDLNYAEPYEVEFAGGVMAGVAKDCIEADLLINIPKLKTHFEVGMSVCMKNLMGCLVGQVNKKKTHLNLAENILCLNRALKPHLHIVDGMIAMEGLGPTRGTPIRADTILVGTDPVLIDYACTKIAGFDYKYVRTLALAESNGRLTSEMKQYADSLGLTARRSFAPPKGGPLATFIHSPKRQKYFLKVRNTRFFTYLASTKWFGNILFLTGLRQDVFRDDNLVFEGLALNETLCSKCGVCSKVCPVGLDLPSYLASLDDRCIHCLYCYLTCPQKAIEFKGKPGFLQEQIRQYDTLTRGLFRE